MGWSQQVYSEMISTIAWDETNNELLVTFKRGKTAAYQGFTEEFAHELANAPSVGSMFIDQVKNSGAGFRYV